MNWPLYWPTSWVGKNVVDQSEKEQIEEFRAWWNEYGNYVIAGVVIGALLLFGWNYYKSSKASAEIGASMLYDELTDHVAEDRVAEAERVMGDLEGTYPESIYAAQSRLAMARLYMDNNRDADAASVLRELVESKSSPTFAAVARLRLARVLLYQEKFDEVLALLDLKEAPGFAARYAEARGDALVARERFDEAREEYLVSRTMARLSTRLSCSSRFSTCRSRRPAIPWRRIWPTVTRSTCRKRRAATRPARACPIPKSPPTLT